MNSRLSSGLLDAGLGRRDGGLGFAEVAGHPVELLAGGGPGADQLLDPVVLLDQPVGPGLGLEQLALGDFESGLVRPVVDDDRARRRP